MSSSDCGLSSERNKSADDELQRREEELMMPLGRRRQESVKVCSAPSQYSLDPSSEATHPSTKHRLGDELLGSRTGRACSAAPH